jgi:dienelactone hydrolase
MAEADERIPAWLLVPKGPAPEQGWPAILAIHQHAGQFDLGKAEPAGLAGHPMYHYGQELCQRGYVVLCPDQLCFEDRRPSEEQRQQNRAYREPNYEMFEFTRLLLNGSCLQTKYLHDLSCALDVLSSLPQVNAEHIGVIGHSLGGQQTLWISWYDSRVKAAVSSCGFGLLSNYVRDGILHNRAAYVPGLLQHTDTDGLLTAIAPRPFLLTAGTTDGLFPMDGIHALIEAARSAYTGHNVLDHFQSIIFEGGHSFPADVKIEAYAFLDRWLKA